MQWPSEREIVGKKPEGGFVLILALIGIMILIAIGYFALTVSTGDLQIASRLVGERKSFSAAEAGVHIITSTYNTVTPALNDTTTYQQFDSVNDPHSLYKVTNSGMLGGLLNTCPKAFSSEGGIVWSCNNFTSTVNGTNDLYGSQVSIQVGVKGKATPGSTSYDFN